MMASLFTRHLMENRSERERSKLFFRIIASFELGRSVDQKSFWVRKLIRRGRLIDARRAVPQSRHIQFLSFSMYVKYFLLEINTQNVAIRTLFYAFRKIIRLELTQINYVFPYLDALFFCTRALRKCSLALSKKK